MDFLRVLGGATLVHHLSCLAVSLDHQWTGLPSDLSTATGPRLEVLVEMVLEILGWEVHITPDMKSGFQTGIITGPTTLKMT